ncbi:Rieske 2Fe-2S domain-containing protein [Salinilacihabitans rarus]|uniref:Rieske 2Fe-2S domain-containing protein n=1 Tax=Salinilacihabitans rarus TaxID=2961596 RepID=UPI0020C8CA8A|nr:Rieske 2Fe-2S domain-containing protein [Salinilacihabitans rarus]
MADDKYPTDSDRRRFVKGVVGGAALSGVLTVGAAAVSSATDPTEAGGGIMEYRSAVRDLGPAPRGLPQIPIEIDDDGYLQGLWPEPETVTAGGQEVVVSETEIAGTEYTTEWYQYCGVQTFEGIAPDADGQDAYFRYPEALPTSEYPWMEEVEGREQINVEQFADYEQWGNEVGDTGVGKPAVATWRSQDVPPEETVPVIIIRSTQVEEAAQEDEWLAETCPQGFIAYLNKCTHFCCVPGYKRLDEAAEYNAENKIYCNCHQSVYDPFNNEPDTFVSLPRPEGE